jgi:predicted acyltransferase
MKKRNESLDALRGFAILAMVLASSIAGGILPAWMYHGQEPPPYHIWNPDLPGITWVDLVFPFFLFSMGAAFPLALNKKIRSGEAWWKIALSILQRGLLLAFFAIFTMHIRTYMSKDPDNARWCIGLLAFVLIHLQFVRRPGIAAGSAPDGLASARPSSAGPAFAKSAAQFLKYPAFAAAALLLWLLRMPDGSGFSLYRSDIIILVLSNMAVFGAAAWIVTRNKPLYRVLILPLVMGLFLSGAVSGSWTGYVYNWSPFAWLYKGYYIKYLFIIIPGTLAGEWLLERAGGPAGQPEAPPLADRPAGMPERSLADRSAGMPERQPAGGPSHKNEVLLVLTCVLLVLVNLVGLFSRLLVYNLIASLLLGLLSIYLSKKIDAAWNMGAPGKGDFYTRFAKAGCYLLVLGLVFEAYQGGIKKDPSTYSYYFVTSALAFYSLCALLLMEQLKKGMGAIRYLAANGKNPMVAYVAGNLILIPLLGITRLSGAFDLLNKYPLTGFLRGIIFTGVVSLITAGFVKWKLFWKT